MVVKGNSGKRKIGSKKKKEENTPQKETTVHRREGETAEG